MLIGVEAHVGLGMLEEELTPVVPTISCSTGHHVWRERSRRLLIYRNRSLSACHFGLLLLFYPATIEVGMGGANPARWPI
jgi:hypothetical protein